MAYGDKPKPDWATDYEPLDTYPDDLKLAAAAFEDAWIYVDIGCEKEHWCWMVQNTIDLLKHQGWTIEPPRGEG